jgi:hypothetical protein
LYLQVLQIIVMDEDLISFQDKVIGVAQIPLKTVSAIACCMPRACTDLFSSRVVFSCDSWKFNTVPSGSLPVSKPAWHRHPSRW